MEFTIKRKKFSFITILFFVGSLMFGIAGISEFLNNGDFLMCIFGLFMSFTIFLPISQYIFAYKKYGSIVMEINDDSIRYMNSQTNHFNNIPWENVLGIVNIEGNRHVPSYFGIVASLDYNDIGHRIYFYPEENIFEFDRENPNSIFIEINTINSRLSNKKIQKKLTEVLLKREVNNSQV